MRFLFVIANAAAWPIAINLSTGFKTVNPTIVAVGRNIGLSSRRLITDVLALAALPHAISGLEDGVGVRLADDHRRRAFVFGVAGADGGLTHINNAKLFLNIPQATSPDSSLTAILGMAFEFVFGVLERRARSCGGG